MIEYVHRCTLNITNLINTLTKEKLDLGLGYITSLKMTFQYHSYDQIEIRFNYALKTRFDLFFLLVKVKLLWQGNIRDVVGKSCILIFLSPNNLVSC